MKYVIVSLICCGTTVVYPCLKEAEVLPQLSSHEQITRTLHKSVKVRNTQAAYVAISLGADVNACDPTTGYPPLIEAVVGNDTPMVRTLLSCGADCSKPDKAGNSVYHYVQILSEKQPKQADDLMYVLESQ